MYALIYFGGGAVVATAATLFALHGSAPLTPDSLSLTKVALLVLLWPVLLLLVLILAADELLFRRQ